MFLTRLVQHSKLQTPVCHRNQFLGHYFCFTCIRYSDWLSSNLCFSLYIESNDRHAVFTSYSVRNYNLWYGQNECEGFTFLLCDIYIRFGSKLYRHIAGIPMVTNCAPLVADLVSPL